MNSKENSKPVHSNKKRNIFLTIGSITIFILAAISFIFLPAMGGGQTEQNEPFGKYMGKPIIYEQGSYFANLVANEYNQTEAMGNEINQFALYQIYYNAFRGTAINFAFTDEVEKSHYALPNTLLDRTIMQLPIFVDPETNSYSPRLYAQLKNSERVALRDDISSQLLQQRYAVDVFSDQTTGRYGLKKSSKEVSFIESLRKNMRSINYVTFSIDNYPEEMKVAYGTENANLFAKYDVSVITLATESAATKLKNQITANEITFEDGVSQFSTNEYAETSGKITDPYFYNIQSIIPNQADIDAIATLTPGDISNVIPTASGFSLFRLDWVPTEADLSDPVTIETIFSYMKKNEIGKIEDYFIERANIFSSEAVLNGFDIAAQKNNLETITTSAFNLNYGDNELLKSISTENEFSALYGASTNEKFLTTVFSLRENEISSPMLIGSNVIVIQATDRLMDDSENVEELYRTASQNFDSRSIEAYVFDETRFEDNFFSVFNKNIGFN